MERECVLMEGREHFYAQGGRESCLGEGSERVLILGGSLSSSAKGSQHKLPSGGTIQRVSRLGDSAAQAGRRQGGRGEGRLLYTEQNYEISSKLGEETNICTYSVPAI